MPNMWYIKSETEGYYIGSFLWLGFFESSIEAGEADESEEVVAFRTHKDARDFLDTWFTIPDDVFITDIPPKRKIRTN